MTDEPNSTTDMLIRQIIALAESRHMEFKRVSGKMVGKALETVCAFANTAGGTLVLGVADLKEHQGVARLFGVEENPEAVDELLRKLLTEFQPSIDRLRFRRVICKLQSGPAKGKEGSVLLLQVDRSPRVHSIVNGGTYTRLSTGNRMMSAREVADLSYQRGERSASSELVPIALERLQTGAWQRFAVHRGPLSGAFADQLLRIGLAEESNGVVQPRRAAVLLFADEPGGLLAAFDCRADLRLMIYDGKHTVANATPNLRKPAKTVRGPLVEQIDTAVRLVLSELAQGLTLSSSGFRTVHGYPERVVKEAIVNAVIHRDYRLNRDIFVRIFDDRIEVENPGLLPGDITPSTIAGAGSNARNPLIAANLREFPEPPNIDAGEGVPMMFAQMAQANLYPPQYSQSVGSAVECVTLTLFNAKRPTAWDVVSDWIDRHGLIANADVMRIANVDTLKASKMLIGWRDQGLLTTLSGRAKRNMAYTKASREDVPITLFSTSEDNNHRR